MYIYMRVLLIHLIPQYVAAHGDLLEVTTSVFLSCALSHLPTPGKLWSEENSPVAQATHLLSHVVKLLSVFVHVIEEREPELKEKVQSSLSTYLCTVCLSHSRNFPNLCYLKRKLLLVMVHRLPNPNHNHWICSRNLHWCPSLYPLVL